MKKAVVLLSGGLDSATVAAIAKESGYEIIALSFRYGQRHHKELHAATNLVKVLNIADHHIIDVNLSQWGGSSLTDKNIDIPQLESKKDEIPSTYVPGRNTVFIAIALSLAEAKGAEAVFLGINAVDYSGYPDCRPEYLAQYQKLANLASKTAIEGKQIELIAPLVKDTKVDIVKRALSLGVPIAETWSCYQGDSQPCGVCDSCRIRDRALIAAGRADLASEAVNSEKST